MPKKKTSVGTAKAIRAANAVKPSKIVQLIKALLMITGAVIFLATAASLFFVNFNFGAVMLAGGALLLILYGYFFERLIKVKWLNRGLLTIGVLCLALMIFIGVYGQADNPTYHEDAVVVLGAGIRGERVSPTLARRLDKAVEYLEENREALVVVSGARGPQEDVTEALAMERYLVGEGVPAERIIKEEAATNTRENLVYAKAILDGIFSEPYEIVVSTSDFHIYRASKLAEKAGLSAAHIHSKTIWHEIPRNYLRECVAVCKFWLLGK